MPTPVPGSDVEKRLLNEVSRDQLWEFTRTIAKDQRMSGSAEEREAFRYIADTLRSFNVEVEEYEHDGWVSQPISARLLVQSPGSESVDAITHSFSISGRVDGLLVDVGNGTESAYAGKDVAGRIVLVDGLAAPGSVLRASQKGAAGAVFINDANFRQMIVTPIWGTPTPDTINLLPNIPVVSVKQDGGDRLRELLTTGKAVNVSIETEVRTGWRRLPVVFGTVRGAHEPDQYVMMGGHVDSWFYGAMDNATANASTLECMRVLANHRDQLWRSFRVAFWSGHSHGRYSGSTWHADTFWEDLYDHCVAYVNIDSTGGTGATSYEEVLAMPELAQLASEVVAHVTGQTAEVARVGRAADQSFWGIGLPSLFTSISKVPPDPSRDLGGTTGALLGRRAQQAWFWHTEHDTLDQIDLEILETDTRIYLAAVLRLVNSPVLPLNFSQTVGELLSALQQYRDQAGQALTLDRLIERAQQLRERLEKLENQLPSANLDESRTVALNHCLVEISRALVPLNYTETGPFEHDLALHAPPLPLLREVPKLASLDSESDEHRFLRTKLIRRGNEVAFALRRAVEATDRGLALLNSRGS